MTRPGHPEQGVAEMQSGRVPWTGGDLEVNITTQEFTSICPTTGQPDFNTIEISYKPGKFYLESKTVKFYLWSFREFGAHCETLARRIAEDVCAAIEPESVSVTVRQSPRGGLGIVSQFTKEGV